MIDINLYINDLLYLHDCVILPGFGGFVTNYVNASISEKNIFFPPRKIVAFNIKLINDDGLLINYIVDKESITYTEAKGLVIDYVRNLKNTLNSLKEINFEGIGYFKIDNNKILQFNPLQTTNFNIETYGLSSFHFQKIKHESEVDKVKNIFKDKNEKDSKLVKLPLKRIIAASFLIVILTMISYDTNIIKDLKVNLTSLYPSVNNANPKNAIIKTKTITNKKEVTTNSIIKESKPKVEIKTTNIIPKQIDQTISDEKQYQIIAGCFKVLTNAENFVTELTEKGLTPTILISHRGLYKVSVGSFDSKEEAISQINNLHNSSSDVFVWLATK